MISIWWLVATLAVICSAYNSGLTKDLNDLGTRNSSGVNSSGVYTLFDSYNYTNFFNKFDFFEVWAQLRLQLLIAMLTQA
jgi:hypothetical protein